MQLLQDATFVYNADCKWFDITCYPEDEASICEEFANIIKAIEKEAFRLGGCDKLLNSDGVLKVREPLVKPSNPC